MRTNLNICCALPVMGLLIPLSGQPVMGQAEPVKHVADFAEIPLSKQGKPKEGSLVDQMKQVFEGSWTELHISSTLLTDYGAGYVAAIELKREKAGAPVMFREVRIPAKDYRLLTDDQFNGLLIALMETAEDLKNYFTPGEVMASVRPEEVTQLFEKGILPKGGWDGEEILLHSNAAQGLATLSKGGHAQILERFLERELKVGKPQMSRDELKLIFGKDPFDFSRL